MKRSVSLVLIMCAFLMIFSSCSDRKEQAEVTSAEPVIISISDTLLETEKETVPETVIGDELYVKGSFDSDALNELYEALDSFPGRISVIAKSLNGKKELVFHDEYRYDSECLSKFAHEYALCMYMEENNISKDYSLVYDWRHYQPGSGEIQYYDFGTYFTLEELITYSLSISDNCAYEILREEYGQEYKNSVMEKIGCKSLISEEPWYENTDPWDWERLLESAYGYMTGGSRYASLLKKACTDTPDDNLNEGMKYSYSHKVGDSFDGQTANDICIVWADTPYFLVVLTRSDYYYGSYEPMYKIGEIINGKLF